MMEVQSFSTLIIQNILNTSIEIKNVDLNKNTKQSLEKI